MQYHSPSQSRGHSRSQITHTNQSVLLSITHNELKVVGGVNEVAHVVVRVERCKVLPVVMRGRVPVGMQRAHACPFMRVHAYSCSCVLRCSFGSTCAAHMPTPADPSCHVSKLCKYACMLIGMCVMCVSNGVCWCTALGDLGDGVSSGQVGTRCTAVAGTAPHQ